MQEIYKHSKVISNGIRTVKPSYKPVNDLSEVAADDIVNVVALP